MGTAVTGWWRANAVALGALVVLVPALALTVGWNEYSGFSNAQASSPITIEPGDSAEYAEATIGPATAEFVERPLTPEDARVVRVRIPVQPGDPALACSRPVLRELGGARREWHDVSTEVDPEWDWERVTLCSTEETAPYALDLDYVVPADAAGPFAVEISSPDLLPSFAKVIVEP